MKKYDLVIVGGGSGGLSAAVGASQLGLKTLLIEKRKLGGDCLWYGCIPSKTLLHEAQTAKTISEEITNFDLETFFQKTKKRILEVQMGIAEHDSVKRFNDLGVEVEIGEARFVDNNKVKVGEKVFRFKKCIIATGSSPRIPDTFKGVNFYTNETFFEMDKLPETLLVVGGGSIGVEMASAMAMFGVKVKMILKENLIMPKEEKEVGEFMMSLMQESLGIEYYQSVDIKEAYEREGHVYVDIGNGVVLKGDKVLVAVGRIYNTNLDLLNAGVKFDDKGITVDDYLQTSNKNIYAIGDVNGIRLFTHAAGYQAKSVIQNIIVPNWLAKLFPFLKKKTVPEAFPWVTYTYPEVAHVGMYKKDLQDKDITFKEYKTSLENVDRAHTAKINKDGYINILIGEKGRVLGVTIVAPQAGELITEWTLAISNNLSVERIFDAIHAYPTLSELNTRGTLPYMTEKLTPIRKRILKLLFKI